MTEAELVKMIVEAIHDPDDLKTEEEKEHEVRECMKLHRMANCNHKNAEMIPEGTTGMLGRVVCPDCGHSREWEAY